MKQGFLELPRWECHKVVSGDKIVEIREVTIKGLVIGRQWLLACDAIIDVVPSWIVRGAPVVGDYMVRYDDGYTSWSPAAAFEDGYTRLADQVERTHNV
jgi:hypothetical protein